MIFKYCVRSNGSKDDTKSPPQLMNSRADIEIIKRSLFICCPCAFRRRQSVGIENINNDEISIITEIPFHITTPIISLRPNQNGEFINKTTNVDNEETEYNEKNRRNISAQANPYKRIPADQAECLGHDRELYEFSSDGSNERDNEIANHRQINENDIRICSPDKSFNIITHNSNISCNNLINQLPMNISSSTTTDSTDIDKETSSDDIPLGREVDSDDHPAHDPPSSSSVISNDSNSIDEVAREVVSPHRTSGIKAIAFDETDGPDISLAFDQNCSNVPMIDIESRMIDPINSESIALFQSADFREHQEKSKIDDNDDEVEKEEEVKNEEVDDKSKAVSIIIASRPHSRAAAEYSEVSIQPLDIRQSHEATETSTSGLVIHELSFHTTNLDAPENISITNEIISTTKLNMNELSMDTEIRVLPVGKMNRVLSGSLDNGIAHEIAKIHVDANEVITPKRFQSRVPRSRLKTKTGLNRIAPVPITNNNMEKSIKLKSSMSQCLAQLESNDWEIAIKGLKSFSIIARQQPDQLDTSPPGSIGRLLGRHVRNLRSQVSRMACMAAGDAFETQAHCIDQELDDIVGPLLHRTADTNKFLRADSNAALDRMIEHLPPHRTITVIVYRGASHQNAVVRATTARLLCSLVDQIGPNLAMTLPRDVREKLLSSGAKLLMDGNLDARNHAKNMFKRLSRCEGFRKALTDCVPEATLRHIDKTLRSL